MQRQRVYEQQRQRQREQTNGSLNDNEHDQEERKTQRQPYSQHSQHQKRLEERDLPAAQQHRQMQKQVGNYVGSERVTNVREAPHTGRQQNSQQQNNQQKPNHAQHTGHQQQYEHQHYPAQEGDNGQHRSGDADLSPQRGSGEARGDASLQQSQFMAWPGGATLASAFWNAQEKVVQHFKQLQLLENPFTSSSAIARESSSPRYPAPTERQTPPRKPFPLISSKSSPSPAQAEAASTVVEAAAASGQGGGGVVGHTTNDFGAAGTGAEAEAVAAAAAAAATAVETLSFQQGGTAAEAHAQHRSPAVSPLRRDEKPYTLVTFANGRPLHVHHVCNPPPYGNGRSASMPGNEDRKNPLHTTSLQSLFRSDSSLNARINRKEGEYSVAVRAPAAAIVSGTPEPVGVRGVLESCVATDKLSAGGMPAAAGDRDLSETSRPGESISARDSTRHSSSHSNNSIHSNSSSRDTTSAVHVLSVAKDVQRLAPALGDLGQVHASPSLTQACAVSFDYPAAGSSDSAAAANSSGIAALRYSPLRPHIVDRSNCSSNVRASSLHRGGSVHAADTLPCATASSLGVTGVIRPNAQVAAAPVAAKTDVLHPYAATAANVSGVVCPQILDSPGAAHASERIGSLATPCPDVTGRAALLQLTAAFRQLSGITRQLLLLCALLPLACVLSFSAWPLPTAEDTATAAAAEGIVSPHALPRSSCFQIGAAPGFLVHALWTVYLLVVGNAAWNLWRLHIPQDSTHYRPVGYYLPTAYSSERQGMRPQHHGAAAAGRIEGGATEHPAAVIATHGGAPCGGTPASPGRREERSLAAAEEGSPAETAAEGGGQETNQGDKASAALAASRLVVRARPSTDNIEGAGQLGMGGEDDRSERIDAFRTSRRNTEEDLPQSLGLFSFLSSVSTSTVSDVARATERHIFLENIPVSVTSPLPPPSAWPQWPVLLRATQEPWIVQKTEEVLQRQLTRMFNNRGTASKHENKEMMNSLPALKYPRPPLLFMTPETVDPHLAIIPFETPFFRGRLFVCIPTPGSNSLKKDGIYGKRAMQACVQGQFLQRYRVGEVLTGQAFYRPLRSLPPQWMVSLGLKVAKQLTSVLEEDIFANMPYFLTPAACSAETLHVAPSRRIGEERRAGGEQGSLLQAEVSSNIEEDISPPDLTQLSVPEETRLLGGPFARGGISAQQRKSLLNNRELLRKLQFDPDLVYTFNFVQNIFYPSTYEFDLGIMKLDLAPYLNQQPIEVMALIDDAFVKEESSPSSSPPRMECRQEQQQQEQQHQQQQQRKKGSKKPRSAQTSTQRRNKNVRGIQAETEGEAEERLKTVGEGENELLGQHKEEGNNRREGETREEEESTERHSSKYLGEEGENESKGLKKAEKGEDEEEEDEGDEDELHEEDEEEEEDEDADPSTWNPPANERKFIWRFQMWHDKLLDERS